MKQTNVDIKAALAQNSEAVECALEAYTAQRDADLQTVFDAQRYSLLGGGKRIRPFLVNEFCRVLGGISDGMWLTFFDFYTKIDKSITEETTSGNQRRHIK